GGPLAGGRESGDGVGGPAGGGGARRARTAPPPRRLARRAGRGRGRKAAGRRPRSRVPPPGVYCQATGGAAMPPHRGLPRYCAALIRFAASFTRLTRAVAQSLEMPPFFFLAALAIALRAFFSFASACLRSFRFLLADAPFALSTRFPAALNRLVMPPGTLSFAQASSPDGGVSKMQVTPSKPVLVTSAGQLAD